MKSNPSPPPVVYIRLAPDANGIVTVLVYVWGRDDTGVNVQGG
jgi:hypothetical protein